MPIVAPSYMTLFELKVFVPSMSCCKNTVKGWAAIFVSQPQVQFWRPIWNDYVLSKENLPLQDTNDTYLANMQKDGSYSVIPRVPGGEITPDKLLVLAQVAKKYDLYTKLTGGQRIGLFGARKEQLPAIWEELIQVGFETGQAYGKSLRTAKSCVGSMWCRYGVQDSVGMAINLENRLQGASLTS